MRRNAELDFWLTMALDIHDKDLLCPCGCGYYRAEAHDPDYDGWFAVDDSTICQARAARELYEKEDGQDADPGTLIMIVDERVAEARKQKLAGDRDLYPINRAPVDEALG